MQPSVKKFKPGTHLFRENDHSRELYIIQDGIVDVYRRIASQDVVLARLEKGAVLGEMALIDGKPRSASAKAATECTAIRIDSETFYDKTRDVPPWFLSLIRTTSQKIRKANQRLESTFSQNVGIKIVLTFNYFVRQHLTRHADGRMVLDTRAIQTRIVQLLGITQQRVIQVLAFIQTHGFTITGENTITMRDPAYFESYCRFLRGTLKKTGDHPPPFTADQKRLLTGAAIKYPDLATGAGPVDDCCADDMTALMNESGVEEEFASVAEQFKQWGLLRTRKSDTPAAEDDRNPLTGHVFSFNGAMWSRWLSHHRFQNMIPNV